jgi:DNA invertase Pin-like site-specific DNA recombinase
MDALYFRVSSERQTTENQFEDLLQLAEKDTTGRNWNEIRQTLSTCIVEEERRTRNGRTRTVYRVRPEIVAELSPQCVYVEQGKSSKAGSQRRPLFEQMKRDAAARKFDRLLVWKVSRLGRDMREVIATVYRTGGSGRHRGSGQVADRPDHFYDGASALGHSSLVRRNGKLREV